MGVFELGDPTWPSKNEKIELFYGHGSPCQKKNQSYEITLKSNENPIKTPEKHHLKTPHFFAKCCDKVHCFNHQGAHLACCLLLIRKPVRGGGKQKTDGQDISTN